MTVGVVIVDDQAMVRAGFAALLEAKDDIAVLGEAADGEQALRVVNETRPDVVLMDIRMPVLDGLEATRRLLADADPRAHQPRVLVLTTFDVDDYVYDALRAGASGFILKDAPPDELARSVRQVAVGDSLLAPSVTRRLVAEVLRGRPAVVRDDERLATLTQRETEVLMAVARGSSNREIAEALFVGDETVKTHLGNIFAKLKFRDRAQAVVFAYESGLVRPGPDGS